MHEVYIKILAKYEQDAYSISEDKSMNNPERLLKKMQPGKVYRRKTLEGFTTAVDRDLKTLVQEGEVRKVASGLYCRLRANVFGFAPPDDAELVRAFLKSEDFLLTSYNYFTQLGL